jgi:hypothetical protein
MGEHREVMHDRLYRKARNGGALRKNAAGRLRHLLATGWRETERWEEEDHVTVRLERTGHRPKTLKPFKPATPPPRAQRSGGYRGGNPGASGGGGRRF